MAAPSSSFDRLLFLFTLFLIVTGAAAQLSATFYSTSCPRVQTIVRSGMASAVAADPRMGASILRLFFHDCFVNGCDGSVLLDDTATSKGEKAANPNAGSLRGFEVIDAIKTQVEAACTQTVSCADILALAARDGVNLLGGPSWTVLLGRRDSKTASLSAANANLPPPSSSINSLISTFAAKGLSSRDMTVLSGAHTIGQAQCSSFRSHIYSDSNISPAFAVLRQKTCPTSGGNTNLAPLDALTGNRFDTGYFRGLVNKTGLMHSDQELFNGGPTDLLVQTYSTNSAIFNADFVTAILKMGNISPLTGTSGEIRVNCRKTN